MFGEETFDDDGEGGTNRVPDGRSFDEADACRTAGEEVDGRIDAELNKEKGGKVELDVEGLGNEAGVAVVLPPVVGLTSDRVKLEGNRENG